MGDLELTQKLILLSGAPGVGKSSIATPLAKELGFALITKDHIKEALFETLGGRAGDRECSHRLSTAAMEVLWSLAKLSPHVVLDANFRPHSAHEQSQLHSFRATIVELHCTCPPEELRRRFEQRAANERHHPAHPIATFADEWFAEYDRPMGVGTVLEIDVSRPVDLPSLVNQIRRLLGL